MEYQAVIGMEVHVELSTKSKMFCGCEAEFFGAEPNVNVCPTCLGLPGALPFINQKAVEYTMMLGRALNCEIQPYNVFARKNYFYPDLPKGFQISQYELPLCLNGYMDVEPTAGEKKRIRIRRIHLEEDTGKLTHVGKHSLVDLNRAGVPLMEIVTEADISSAEEAYAYVTMLRQMVRYLGIGTGDMEKGAMRCEVNLSLMKKGATEWGTKVEVKNLNSFRSVRQAIAYEIERQSNLLDEGGTVEQVTMGWDENNGVTVRQRVKEGDTGYRYFPEPDLPPLKLDTAWIEQVVGNLPELPQAKQARYLDEFGLNPKDTQTLVEDREIAEFFDQTVTAAEGNDKVTPKLISNWVTGELFRLLNENDATIGDLNFTPEQLVTLIQLVAGKTINQTAAKQVLGVMFESGKAPKKVVKELGLEQISDSSSLLPIAQEVISKNPKQVAQFKGGKETIIKFFVGQVMKATRGKANPKLAEEVLREELGKV